VVAVFENGAVFPAGVTDSKKTTEKLRSSLYLPLCRLAADVGVGHAWPWEIDNLGVSTALQLCYARALLDLRCDPELLIVDGSNMVQAWKKKQVVEPKADLNHPQVSAASMIAKHLRDTMMCDYAKRFPQYGWDKNKGYGTFDHEQAIKTYGLMIDMGDTNNYMHRRHYCRKILLRTP
jgi:ribonuclease HII